MKNLKKKNNKGFSLVELIVVVMIMAILAVALAPQVMKWVGNSRLSSDVSTYESIYAATQLALTDVDTYDDLMGTAAAPIVATITINDTGTTIASTNATAQATLRAQFAEILGANYTGTSAKVSGESYIITITNCTLAKTDAPTTTLN